MGIFSVPFILVITIICLAKYESPDKISDRNDNDPNCSIKTDKWYKAHPEDRKKYLNN